jgi:putative flippase GtrA
MSDSLSFSTPSRTGLIRRVSVRFGGKKHKEVERFLKFAVVGAIGAIIDLGLTNLLLHFVLHPQHGDDRPVQIATAIGFVTAVMSNFIFNRFWTYPDSRTRPIAAQLTQFFMVNSVGLGIRELVVTLLNTPFATLLKNVAGNRLNSDMQVRLGANMAIMVALGIVMMWNFLVNRYWTYNDVG